MEGEVSWRESGGAAEEGTLQVAKLIGDADRLTSNDTFRRPQRSGKVKRVYF